jgi:hypothetical protein
MEGLISTNNQHNLIDIYIILQPQIAEKTLFKSLCGILKDTLYNGPQNNFSVHFKAFK